MYLDKLYQAKNINRIHVYKFLTIFFYKLFLLDFSIIKTLHRVRNMCSGVFTKRELVGYRNLKKDM